MSSLSPYLNSKKIRGELADEADKKIPLIPSSPLKDIMAIDCDSARTWLIVFAVYSGLLTGALIGFLIIRFLKRKKSIPKARKSTDRTGVENQGFNNVGIELTPGRLQDDLEAQRRYRADASPIALRRDSRPNPNQTRPSVAESYHSAAVVEPDSVVSNIGANRATYLELQAEPNEDVNSMKSFSSQSASTLYDDVQSELSKSKTSLRDARNSVSSSVVFYDARDVDSIVFQQEDIYQEVPDTRKSSRSSKSSKSSAAQEVLYDDAQVTRPKKKAAPLPPPLARQQQVQEESIEKTSIHTRSSSSSSSSSSGSSTSSQSAPKSPIKDTNFDKDFARKSFQNAPDQYRKESAYIDVDAVKSPALKTEIASIIANLGEDVKEDEAISEESSTSSSSSSDENDDEKEEIVEVKTPVKFQRRKSSFSSTSEVDYENVNLDVDSFHDKPSVNIDDDIKDIEGTSDSDSSSSSSSESDGELVIQPEPQTELVIDVIRKSPVTNGQVNHPVDDSSASEDDEPSTLKRTEVINLQGFTSSSHSDSSDSESDHVDATVQSAPLQFATEAIDDGAEIQMCTPVTIETDESSSSSEEEIKQKQDPVEPENDPGYELVRAKLNRIESTSSSSSSDSSSSSSSSSSKSSNKSVDTMKEKVHSNGIENDDPPIVLPRLGPTPRILNQRATKSLDRERSRSKTSSSSSSRSSSSEDKRKPRPSLKKSDLTDSFLKRLNKSYEPVYFATRLKKVNSTTQTEQMARSKSTDQW